MSAPKQKSKMTILVADPDETSRNVVSIMLHKLGYREIMEAVDKGEADEVIARLTRDNSGMAGLLGSSAPGETVDLDLLILDAGFSPAGGAAYLSGLRKRFKPDELPVLAIGSKDAESRLAETLDAGANHTLQKPFSRDSLRAALDSLLVPGGAPVIRSFSFAQPRQEQKREKPRNSPAAGDRPASTAPPKALMAERTASGGASFHSRQRAQKGYSTDSEPTAVLIDGKIDGHYHEKVDVIGGGVNCFWARKVDEEEIVRLEYISARGRPTGMVAKDVSLERFMYTFHLCDEGNCPILSRLAEEKRT
ncbi:MAG: response regulator [Candidatus Nitrospinota bacterium M3_3B_026]